MTRLGRKIILNWAVPPIIFLLPFLVPVYHLSFDLNTLLTVVSLVFAILVGFFIATATANYLRLRSLVTEENCGIITIFNLTKVMQPRRVRSLASTIDDYVTLALDFELDTYIDRSQKEFDKFLHAVDRIQTSSARGLELMQSLHDTKNHLIEARQEIKIVSQRMMSSHHWFTILLLSTLMYILLFSVRDVHWLSFTITGILSVAIYMILVIVYEIDANIFSEESFSWSSSQDVFLAIGKMKYFPQYAVLDRRVPEPQERYRLGYFSAGSKKRTIKIIDGLRKSAFAVFRK